MTAAMRGPVVLDSAAIELIEIGQEHAGANPAFDRPDRRKALDLDMIYGLAHALALGNNPMPG